MSNAWDEFHNIVRTIRRFKNENNITKSGGIIYIVTDMLELLGFNIYIVHMCKLDSVVFITEADKPTDKCAYSVISDNTTIYLPLTGLIDIVQASIKRNKETTKLISEIVRLENKLDNEGFICNAPAKVIETQKALLESNKVKLLLLQDTTDETI